MGQIAVTSPRSLSQVCFSRQLSFFVSRPFGNAIGDRVAQRGCQRGLFIVTFFGKRWNASPREFFFSPREEGGKKCGELSEVCVGKREREKQIVLLPPPPTKVTDLLSWSRTVYGERSSRKILSYLPRASISRIWIEEHASTNTFPPKKNFLNKFKKGFIFLKKYLWETSGMWHCVWVSDWSLDPFFSLCVCLQGVHGCMAGRKEWLVSQIRGIWGKKFGGGEGNDGGVCVFCGGEGEKSVPRNKTGADRKEKKKKDSGKKIPIFNFS